MQKVINVLAVASAAVSVAVVGSGLYVYVNRGAIIDGIKSQALEAVLGGSGGIGGALGGASGVGADIVPAELPLGTNDLAPSAPQASAAPSVSQGAPSF